MLRYHQVRVESRLPMWFPLSLPSRDQCPSSILIFSGTETPAVGREVGWVPGEGDSSCTLLSLCLCGWARKTGFSVVFGGAVIAYK